jgi:hypothetical protein
MKIELFWYDTRFFSHSSLYDVRRPPPQTVPPRRISNTQFKKTLPAVARRGPEAGSIEYSTIFMLGSESQRFMSVSTE